MKQEREALKLPPQHIKRRGRGPQAGALGHSMRICGDPPAADAEPLVIRFVKFHSVWLAGCETDGKLAGRIDAPLGGNWCPMKPFADGRMNEAPVE